MKRRERKKRARKFNVCKKMCQLNKVYTLFMTQNQEQNFQRQYINNLYGVKISAVLGNSWQICQTNYDSVDSIFQETQNKYKNIYFSHPNKYPKIVIDLNVYIQSTSEMHNRKLDNFEKQIEIKKKDINYINEKILKFTFTDKRIDYFKSNLTQLVKEANMKFKQQKNQIWSEFTEKVTKLNVETENRLKNIIQENEIEKKLIMSNSNNNKKDHIRVNLSENLFKILQKQLKSIQFAVKNNESKFIAVKTTTSKNIAKIKEKIINESKEMIVLKKKYQKNKKRLLADFESFVKSSEKTNEEQNKQKNQQMNTFYEKEKQMKSNVVEIMEKFANNRMFLESNQLGRLSNQEAIFNDIRKVNKIEVDNFKRETSPKEKVLIEGIKTKEEEIKCFLKDSEKTEQDLSSQLNSTIEKNRKEKEEIEKLYLIEKQKNENEFFLRKEVIRKRIYKLMNDKENLKKEKEEIISRFNYYFDSLEKEEMKEIEELKSSFKLTFSELKTQFSNDINKLSQKCSFSIQKVKDECEKKRTEKVNQNNFLFGQKIAKINLSNNNLQKNEIEKEKINESYNNLFLKYQMENSQIDPPKFPKGYSKLADEISNLNSILNQKIKEIAGKRKEMNSKYEALLLEEEKRHSCILQEQNDKEIICEKIKKVRQQKEEEVKRLERIHKNSIETIENVQKDFERKLDLIELHFLNQKTLKLKEIDILKANLETEKNNLIKQISEIREKYAVESQPLRSQLNELMKKRIHSVDILNNEETIRMMRNHKTIIKKLRDRIHDVKTAQQLTKSEHEHRLFINREKYLKFFEENNKKNRREIQELIIKKDELDISYSNLVNNCNNNSSSSGFCFPSLNPKSPINSKIQEQKNKSVVRVADEERIQKLTQRLENVNEQLNLALNEFQRCKMMLMAQERKMNASFGHNQTVAVLNLATPRFNE